MASALTPHATPVVMATYDMAVVGAGIVGLGQALAASRIGKRVVVIDRDVEATGASVRNFGFVTVTGQPAGDCWRRARRSRDIWAEIAPKAHIPVEHEGLLLVARRPEAWPVLAAFLATEMGAGCRLLSAAETRAVCPAVRPDPLAGGLWSPHELRIESRLAVPRLAAWLEHEWGVTFLRRTAVTEVAPPRIATSRGVAEAGACVVCPGSDLSSLYPHQLFAYDLSLCSLHMLRLAPQPRGWRLPAAVMSDLSLIRYGGYAALPEAAALRQRIEIDQPEAVAHGVHLIVVQSGDGSLVVGDSHHYGPAQGWAVREEVEAVILDELHQVLDLPNWTVMERWIGVYPYAVDQTLLVDRPDEGVRVVVVSSGTGASTAFAIGEEVVADLFDDASGS